MARGKIICPKCRVQETLNWQSLLMNDNHYQGHLVQSLLCIRQHAKCIYSEEEKDTLGLREFHFCYMSLGHFFYWDKTYQLPDLGMLEGNLLKTFTVIFYCSSLQSRGNSTIFVSLLNFSLTSQPLCPLFGH